MPIDPRMFAPIKIGDILERGQQRELRKMQIENEKAEIEGKRAERDAYAQVFSGGMDESGVLGRPNRQSLGALARVNPEAAMKVQKYFDSLDETSQKREEQKWKVAAPLLAEVGSVPYERRRQLIEQAAPILMAHGWTQEELMSVDPTDDFIKAASSTALTVEQVRSGQKLNWHPIGENGSFATDQYGNPVGEGNPFAPQNQQMANAPQPQPNDLNGVFQSLIQQESGGRPGIRGQRTAYGIPLGKTQMLPETAQEMAQKLGLPWQPELLTGTSPGASAYQEKLGRAYFDEGLNKHGGNVERALMYYHGGPDEKLWGPKTRTYAKSVLARSQKGGARKVSSKAQYDALPSGAQYIAPDGSLRTKS
jgi:hypothetical protein